MALIKCKECETEVSSKAETCPKCGARVAAKPMGCGTLIGVIFLGGIIISVFSGIFSSGTSSDKASSSQSAFRQVGYLKDSAKNRIFTIAYKPRTTEQEISSHAGRLRHTQGQMTAAYYYPEGSLIPADGVTLAGSVFKANEVLFETPGLSKWHYAYMRPFSGTSKFVDCEKTPDNDLCRKM